MIKAPLIIRKNCESCMSMGRSIFYREYDDHKNCTSSEDNDSNWEKSPSEEDES